jgi:hypothetical protein
MINLDHSNYNSIHVVISITVCKSNPLKTYLFFLYIYIYIYIYVCVCVFPYQNF